MFGVSVQTVEGQNATLSAVAGAVGMSAKYQKRKSQNLFDQLVGAHLKLQRHIKVERLGCLEVNLQNEFDRCLDRKLARLCALEDAIGIGHRVSEIID